MLEKLNKFYKDVATILYAAYLDMPEKIKQNIDHGSFETFEWLFCNNFISVSEITNYKNYNDEIFPYTLKVYTLSEKGLKLITKVTRYFHQYNGIPNNIWELKEIFDGPKSHVYASEIEHIIFNL